VTLRYALAAIVKIRKIADEASALGKVVIGIPQVVRQSSLLRNLQYGISILRDISYEDVAESSQEEVIRRMSELPAFESGRRNKF